MNPFDGVGPDLSVFGPLFDTLWKQILAAVWGIVIVVSAVFGVLSIGKAGAATAARNPERLAEARTQALWSWVIFGIALLIGIIAGVAVAFAGSVG